MVTSKGQCFQIIQDEVKDVGEMATTGHKEVDTRLVIHAKHAAANHPTVIVISDDTDVFVILLAMHSEIGNMGVASNRQEEAIASLLEFANYTTIRLINCLVCRKPRGGRP